VGVSRPVLIIIIIYIYTNTHSLPRPPPPPRSHPAPTPAFRSRPAPLPPAAAPPAGHAPPDFLLLCCVASDVVVRCLVGLWGLCRYTDIDTDTDIYIHVYICYKRTSSGVASQKMTVGSTSGKAMEPTLIFYVCLCVVFSVGG
jgi:hypothetical protein